MNSFYMLKTRSKLRGLFSLWGKGDKDVLPRKRQLFEMLYLFFLNRLSPNYYKDAGFSSINIPWDLKKLYLNSNQYYKAVWKLNNPDYRKISQNKMSEKAMFTVYNIPTPKYLGYIDKHNGQTCSGDPLKTDEDLEKFLKDKIGTRICFKILEGHGGRGVNIVKIFEENGNIIVKPLDGNNQSVDAYYKTITGPSATTSSIIEEYLCQHDILKRINPSSVNTVRMWVVCKKNNSEGVIGAFLRVGREGSIVDNIDSGGFLCKIHLDTGILYPGEERFDKCRVYRSHPDNGAQIEGVTLPYWREAKLLACNTVKLFPKINFAGVDVALGHDGPMVLEMNIPPDPSGGVRFGYCRRDLLRH